MFPHLFSPLRVGRVTLANRICFLAHRTNLATERSFNDRHIAYYRRRAQGGCGLITVGELSIHPNDRPWETMINAYHPGVVGHYRKLTGSIHDYETLVFAQLNHHGFQSSGAITRQAVWGPSALSDIVFGETAKAMEVEDIEEIKKAFAQCARLAREGGFDGLEIDIGPESLLRQFLSPLSNLRGDHYGGSLENRMRLPLEVIAAVRTAVGAEFTVGLRLCVDEKFWGGISLEESLGSVKAFEDRGQIDFLNVSIGTYYNLHLLLASMHTPLGFTVEETGRIREKVTIPVMASYQITSPRMADDIITNGKADLIGFVRPLICDPDFPQKARKAMPRDIRYCVRDNIGCLGRINQSKALSCTQNPLVGCESLPAVSCHCPRGQQKQVLVVGAGPAGLHAACAATERGHKVVVYEREKSPGGQVNLMTRQPGRKGMAAIIRYLNDTLKRLRVPLVTGIEVTLELAQELSPDAVILATGSKPKAKPVPGEYGPPSVLNVWDVLKEEFPVGETVLFIDETGGHRAAATAEFLADQGKNVTMITSDLFIGIELAPIADLYLTRQRLLQKGVKFRADLLIEEIEGTMVKARDCFTNELMLLAGYQTIVLDMGNEVEDSLFHQVKAQIREVYRVGDCVAPRGIGMAIFEGSKTGQML